MKENLYNIIITLLLQHYYYELLLIDLSHDVFTTISAYHCITNEGIINLFGSISIYSFRPF